jgi:hypothetical protein
LAKKVSHPDGREENEKNENITLDEFSSTDLGPFMSDSPQAASCISGCKVRNLS